MLQLLSQLTVVGDIAPPAFVARVRQLAAGQERVLVVQGEPAARSGGLGMSTDTAALRSSDGENGSLLACGTLLLERKLIRGLGCVGHVEDVVVDGTARSRGVGRLLLDALVALARSEGCYKARYERRRVCQGGGSAPGSKRRSSWTAPRKTRRSTRNAALLARRRRWLCTSEPLG